MKKSGWLYIALALVLSNQVSPVFAQSVVPNGRVANTSEHGASFEENRGQFAPAVRFLLRTPGLDAWITEDGVVYDRYKTERIVEDPALEHTGLAIPSKRSVLYPGALTQRTGHIVRMKFAGSNAASQIVLLNAVPGIRNYFCGEDPSKWVSDVRSFGGFDIHNLYDGIDAAYRVDGGSLRYDLTVRAGADPSAITLRFEGATELLARDGEHLIVRTTMGDLEEADLHAYQIRGGSKRLVNCSFRIIDDSTVRFNVGSYDALATLVIDPLVYSTYLGARGEDQANSIAVDKGHNAYITGFTSSGLSTFPTTTGSYQVSNSGNFDAFVTKIDPTGSRLIYSTYLGGALSDQGNGITIDALGDAFITGVTSSRSGTPPAFPTTAAARQRTNNGGTDAFVAELGPNGNALVYSTYLGGSGADVGNGIALDAAGNAYVTGSTSSSGNYPAGFPVTAGAFQTTQGGGSQAAFVAKVNSTGGVVFATLLGGAGTSTGYGIAIDPSGNSFVSGSTNSTGTYPTGFPTTAGAFQRTNSGYSDGFVTCVAANGASLVYSTYLGGAGDDQAAGITLDPNHNAYVTGYTLSTGAYPTGFPVTAGAYQTVSSGLGSDAFVTKLNPSGTALVYSTYLGGNSQDMGSGIALDNSLRACVTGATESANFPVTASAIQTRYRGGGDDFATILDANGRTVVYSTFLGGSSDESGYGIACDDSGSIYIAGSSASTGTSPNGFPTTSGSVQPTHGGGKLDATVTKIGFTTTTVLTTSSVTVTIAPITLSLCDSAKPTIVVSVSGTYPLTVDSISAQPPLSASGLAFPVTVQINSQAQFVLNYLPKAAGPDSSYAIVHYRLNGVKHDTSVLLRVTVLNGFHLILPRPDTMRGTLCAPFQEMIRIRDSGCEAIQIVAYSLSGSLASAFMLSGTLPMVVSTSQDGQIIVNSNITTAGIYSAQLHIGYVTSNGIRHDTTIDVAAVATSTTALIWGSPQAVKGTACEILTSTVTLKVVGCQDLIVTSATLSGTDAASFRVINSLPITLKSDSLGSIWVTCLDRNPGTYNCALTVRGHLTDGTPFDTSFAVTATVIPGASLNFAKSISISGSTCDDLTGQALIASIDCGTLQILGCSLSGADSANFTVLNSFPSKILSNDSLELVLRFTARVPRSYTALLHIRCVIWDGSTLDTTIPVTATLEPLMPKLAAQDSVVEFGNVPRCTAEDTTIALRNIGCDTLRIDSLEYSAGLGFEIPSLTFPMLLPPGSGTTIYAHYQPVVTGNVTDAVYIHASEQGLTATIRLLLQATGVTGTSTLIISDSTIDFGKVSVCSHRERSVTFASSGCEPVDLSNSSLTPLTGFTIINGHTSTLEPGTSDSLIVEFNPPGNGTYTADLILATSAGAKTIHLSAQGVPDSGKVELSTTAVEFAPATAGCESNDSLFTLHNTSCSAITIDSIRIMGPGSSAFKTPASLKLPVAVGRDSSFEIIEVFTPGAAVDYAATLTVWFHHGDGKPGDTSIALAGLGVAPPVVGVALTSKPLVIASDGYVYIPIYLTGHLDSASAWLSPLRSVTIVLDMNTDLLTPAEILPSIGLPDTPIVHTSGRTTTFTVRLPDSLFYLDTLQLLTVRCRAFVADSLSTVVRLISAGFDLSSTPHCLTVSNPSGETTFPPAGSCADSLISRYLGSSLDFAIQSIVPNPANGVMSITLARRGFHHHDR